MELIAPEEFKNTKPIVNIQQRILGIMHDLEYIQKGDKTVNGQYRFVSHDQVTTAIHQLLVKWGVLPVPKVTAWKQEGNRTSVDLRVDFKNVDQPNDMESVDFFGFGVDSGDKGPGKAISYALKYAYLKMFNLATGDDPDKEANALYEPVKCLEFDLATAEFKGPEKRKLAQFLAECAETSGKDVEEIKTEALKRMEGFLEAFKKWSSKK
jgi:hypothetical protein